MNRNRFYLVLLAIAVLGSVVLAGCNKKQESAAGTDAGSPAAENGAAAPAPAPAGSAPAAATGVSVTAVELGTEAGSDKKITKPAAEFAPNDKIVAAVTTSSSAASPATGTLSAKWTFEDGQIVNEESKDYNFTGVSVTDFEISKPDGWPKGKYMLVVSLDGVVVQTKNYAVK